MRRNGRPLALGLLLAFALAACSSPLRPGVKVRSLETDLGLGILPTPTAAPEQVTVPPLPDLPLFDRLIDRFRIIKSGEVTEICPQAGALEFPAKEATPGLTQEPTAGIYRWKHDVRVLDPKAARQYAGSTLKEVLDRGIKEARVFGARSVRGPSPDIAESALNIPFQTEVPPGSGKRPMNGTMNRGSFNFTVDQVPGLGPSNETIGRGDVFRVQKSSYLDTTNTSADAGEGISIMLTGWAEGDRRDARSMKSWLMAHTPFAELLTFPVVTGKEVRWASSGQAVNPTILAGDPNAARPGPHYTFAYTGKVAGHLHVDACGDLVDSWIIKGQLVTQRDTESPLTIDYDYAIATQLGGLIVYERLGLPAADSENKIENALVIEASMGQLKPSRLS